MDEVGKSLWALLLAMFVAAVFLWLTWYVGAWLGGLVVVYLVVRWLAQRAADQQGTIGASRLKQALYESLRDTLLCGVWGLALLTSAQLIVNAIHWIFGDGTLFSAVVTSALWSSEGFVMGLRRFLTTALSPRISFPLLGAAVFLSLFRPEWRVIKRVFGVRSWVSRAAKVALVVSSMSFFTTEYVSLHEDGPAQERMLSLVRAHSRTAEGLHRLVAAKWTAAQLAQASPAEKTALATLLKAADSSGYGRRVIDAEGARFAKQWSASPATSDGTRAPSGDADGESTGSLAEFALDDRPSPSLASALASVRGPTDAWPPSEVVARAEKRASDVDLLADEAQTGAVEAAKLSLGALVPDSLEPLLKQFVKVTTDAFGKTVAKQWFASHANAIKSAIAEPGPFAHRTVALFTTNLEQALRRSRDEATAANDGSADSRDIEPAPHLREAITERVAAMATAFKQADTAEREAAKARAESEVKWRASEPAGWGSRDSFRGAGYRETYHPYSERPVFHPTEHFGGFRAAPRR